MVSSAGRQMVRLAGRLGGIDGEKLTMAAASTSREQSFARRGMVTRTYERRRFDPDCAGRRGLTLERE